MADDRAAPGTWRLRHGAGLVLLLSALLTRPGHAQWTVAPGDAALTPARIAVGRDTLITTATSPDGRTVAMSFQHRSIARENATLRLVLETRDTARQLVATDTLDLDALTLRPVRSRAVGATEFDLAVHDRHITGWRVSRDSGRVAVDTTTARPFFDGGTIEHVLAALPLDRDTTLVIPSLNPPSPAVRPVTLRFLRLDSLDTHAGREVARVWLRTGNGAEYWVSQRDGRLLQLAWRLPNGMLYRRRAARDVPP
ncbi:MAG: hypothetical protein HY275_11515 [Gemmatimonadetes bacterium]|nr:hypothetical protein [Gemmatimonadota bacterium]